MDRDKPDAIDHLMQAIMTLQTFDECERFFSDLCTDEELVKISRRVMIAKLIIEGNTYRKILDQTNASNITISRIKNVLESEDSILADVVKRI